MAQKEKKKLMYSQNVDFLFRKTAVKIHFPETQLPNHN